MYLFFMIVAIFGVVLLIVGSTIESELLLGAGVFITLLATYAARSLG